MLPVAYVSSNVTPSKVMFTVCMQYAKHKSKHCTVFADVHNDESLV